MRRSHPRLGRYPRPWFSLLHGYPYNVDAGEDVRILGRVQAQDMISQGDWWLFDDTLAAVLVYDGSGVVERVEIHENPVLLAGLCSIRNEALRLAVPLAQYVSEKKIRQRDGAMSSEWDGAVWFKATGSNDIGCVEIAFHRGKIGVRDTKDNGSGPVLAFTEHEWNCFLAGAKKGEFDLP
jgi:hypothetical protein